MIKEAISKVVRRIDLSLEEARSAMNSIMDGSATPSQIASFITALRMKGETVDEITGFAIVMREKASRIKCYSAKVVDTCGTGGDGLHTFNISTASALVAAGAGAVVAKHGNRSVSSSCGSADVLKALGVNIEAELEVVESCINDIGIGFLFAPLLHRAMKFAIGPRREIGIRSVFNVLGPLTNPAGATSQLMGVYEKELTPKLAEVLKNLGSSHVYVVHGEDGEDEISITGPTQISELLNGKITTMEITPEEFGFNRAGISDLKGGEAEENARILRSILEGEHGPRRDAVILNSAAVISAYGFAKDIREAIPIAVDSIDSGKAGTKLEELVRLSNS